MYSVNPKYKWLRAEDEVPFHCRRCGDCCRNLREKVMMETLDAYRIANYLRAHGRPDMDVAMVFSEYAVPVLLPGNFPIYMVKTVGKDEACVFLKQGACSIYPDRLQVCRRYPFAVDLLGSGQDFLWCQCLERPFHFSGDTVQVKDWFEQNFSEEDRTVLRRESEVLPQIGRLIQGLQGAVLDAAIKEMCLLRYFFYDAGQPFLPQYDRNNKELLRRLSRLAADDGSEAR